MIKNITDKKFIKTIQRLLQNLGFAFVIWLFGLLILVPLSDSLFILKSFIGIIIILPIVFLFILSFKDMKLFSQIAGKALCKKYKKTKNPNPFIHFYYACWIIIGIILISPLVFIINNVIGGIFLFGCLLSLIFICFINLKYIIAFFLRYLNYSKD
jgi:hypothetical protein